MPGSPGKNAMRVLTPVMISLAVAGCAGAPLPFRTASIQDEAAARGHVLASSACAGCHAVGLDGASPHPDALPFREIVRKRPLDELEAAMAEGSVTTHPGMPLDTFRASEIDDLIAYLGTLPAE